MSGAEVAGLAFGVVPIVIEILKAYSSTRSRLRTLSHYDQVILDVQLRYQAAAANFGNNCQLLLQAILDSSHEVAEMIKDPKNPGWQNPTIEERFRSFLEQDYQFCESIVVRIRDILRKTREMLARLEPDLPASDNSRQQKIRRFRQAFNITLKENEYRQWLEELDQWNSKLGKLRKLRCKIQKKHVVSSACLIRKAAPKSYSDIRAASLRLDESLQESWSCTNISHTGHQAKLSLDAVVEHGTVRLDMVIACRRRDLTVGSGLLEPPIWLYVRSITSNESVPKPQPQISPPRLSSALQSHTFLSMDSTPVSVSKAPRKKLKKRVHFEDPTDEEEKPKRSSTSKATSSTDQPTDPDAQSFAMLDLKATTSVCCHLSKACSSVSTCKDLCLGYLEKAEVSHSFRLIFYDASKTATPDRDQRTARKDAVPISMLLQHLQILQQLTLAHRLAIATLQYHSTSWLPLDWDLKDFAYFTNSQAADDDITKKLQSLHLSTQFPGETPAIMHESKPSPEDLKYMYGIRNLPLAKLGIALLEICFQKDIASLNSDPMPHNVIRARKILLERPPSLQVLGKNYIEIARKCIDCDFSCGDDLKKQDLQSAVYSDVICPLEDMIKKWKAVFGMD